MENSEKKLPVRNLERIAEMSFRTYEEAEQARKTVSAVHIGGKTVEVFSPPVVKRKIFARWNGTYDLVWYAYLPVKMVEAPKGEAEPEQPVVGEPKVHGLRAKDRRKGNRKGK